ncbi:MAG TPA: GreA/GreB family elongation factor [Verrucomicrobiae bacterium]|nr:GreA/GreB family elongation factor [Verrucomicrobiae bacterium]
MLRKDDYDLILSYLRGTRGQAAFSRQEAEDLQAELQRARIVDKEAFPPDVVRINSRVKVVEKDKTMELTLVTPEKANIKERKVSVMAPIGAALIGFRKGEQVQWKVPAGVKTFTILDVENEAG